MTINMFQFVILSMALLFISDQAGAIECYTGENSGPSQNIKDCGDQVAQCKKEIREFHDESLPTTNYYCGGSNNEDKCEVVDGTNLKKTVCTCTGNLCNQAYASRFSVPLTMLVVLMVIAHG
ncbi:hypothetical protein TCAL_10961 [Tigriopus californicus]|uniref:Protein sleepless n=1 Tax=Tigriopus californicus TaxID=6832 RepID=A0A553PTS1_TIGCA|nr:hypothetical protein TCAL_10961 [Tigriopus californicus]|eukprot:TCALIF_10961-PA protein Name:"Protein of unknown function" AED:0.42 eAED:0.42 QI:43/1/1/1/1/1/3/55/121